MLKFRALKHTILKLQVIIITNMLKK